MANRGTHWQCLQEERNAQELLDEEDKPEFTPQAFDSLRQVPMYSDFIKERFERCLDLYLCPRGKKNRINVDPQTLVPKLPKPQDLQPFPTTLLLRYTGHTGRVSCNVCSMYHNQASKSEMRAAANSSLVFTSGHDAVDCSVNSLPLHHQSCAIQGSSARLTRGTAKTNIAKA